MRQTTTGYRAMKRFNGVRYYDTGGRAADGSPYITTDPGNAKQYPAEGGMPPVGFRVVKVTWSRECLGGGWINYQGTSM